MSTDPLDLTGRVAIVAGSAHGIGKSIAAMFAAHGAVVVVCDIEDASAREVVDQLLSFIPLGWPGQPDDVAGAALYFASDLAAYVTGQNLCVHGGWTAGYNRNF